MIDVAAKPSGRSALRRPWAYGPPTDATRAEVGSARPRALGRRSGPKLVVQPFRDRKASREGYGDVCSCRDEERGHAEDKEGASVSSSVCRSSLIPERRASGDRLRERRDGGTHGDCSAIKPAAGQAAWCGASRSRSGTGVQPSRLAAVALAPTPRSRRKGFAPRSRARRCEASVEMRPAARRGQPAGVRHASARALWA